LASFYSPEAGIFFVSIVMQGACISFIFCLLRPGELLMAFFSSWLAHNRRKYINEGESWRRSEGFVFLYGYYYSYQIVMFAIISVFSTTVPLISICGILFFTLRLLVDSLNILTVNKKEIDSSMFMFSKILNSF
jgi:hypothetical protein